MEKRYEVQVPNKLVSFSTFLLSCILVDMNQPPVSISQLLDAAETELVQSFRPMMRVEHYKLVVRAWRQAKQARDELDNWTYAPSESPYRPTLSERDLRISHIPIINGRPETTDYTLEDLDKIQSWLDNGRDGLPAEQVFDRGWFFDGLERLTRERISWDRLHLRLIREWPSAS